MNQAAANWTAANRTVANQTVENQIVTALTTEALTTEGWTVKQQTSRGQNPATLHCPRCWAVKTPWRRSRPAFAGGARLVTLLGQGGMGKTLLARHALQRAVQQASQGRRDHTGLLPGIMVDLSAVHDEAGVLPAIASAVGARTAQLPDVAQSVRGYELLLLDNFEQVLISAPRIAELLELAPSLRLLITSRERLHLSQEHVLPLEGLAVHSSDAPSTQPVWSDAARLFVRRAARAHLGFVPGDHRADIEQVCTLLRGVPLLIELASAWVRTLSPLDIAAQLGGGQIARGRPLVSRSGLARKS